MAYRYIYSSVQKWCLEGKFVFNDPTSLMKPSKYEIFYIFKQTKTINLVKVFIIRQLLLLFIIIINNYLATATAFILLCKKMHRNTKSWQEKANITLLIFNCLSLMFIISGQKLCRHNLSCFIALLSQTINSKHSYTFLLIF